MNRKLLVAIASGALVLPVAVQAAEFSVSGHINRAITVIDDGNDTKVAHVDGAASGSRFRMTGSEDIGNGMTAGGVLEFGLKQYVTEVKEEEDDKDTSVQLRLSNVYFSGGFGKVTLGQQWVGANLTAWANRDNHAWLGGIEASCDFGAGTFHTAEGEDTESKTCDVAPGYSGFRDDVLRYDTPSLGPATVSLSVGADDYWDTQIEASDDFDGGGGYQIKVGTRQNLDNGNARGNRLNDNTLVMSAAFEVAQGTHFALAWGKQERLADNDYKGDFPNRRTPPDGKFWHVILGHNFGNSSVSFLYSNSEDSTSTNQNVCGNDGYCDGKTWGIGFGHGIPDSGVELYASYRVFEIDGRNLVSIDNAGVFVVGSRITF